MNTPPPREPHSVREALLLEGLGDLRELLERIEAIDVRCRQTAELLQARTAALQAGADQYAQSLKRFDLAARERMTAHVVEQTQAATREALAAIERAHRAAVATDPVKQAPASGPAGKVVPLTGPAAVSMSQGPLSTRDALNSRRLTWAWWLGLVMASSAITTALVLHQP